MILEQELRWELAEDPLENLTFLGRIIKNRTKLAKKGNITPHHKEYGQHLYTLYFLSKVAYEEISKIVPDSLSKSKKEALKGVENNYHKLKTLIAEYNVKHNTNFPL